MSSELDAERDAERLETILKVIADLDRRLGLLDFAAFSADEDEIDLTAYRLSVVGQCARKLTDGIKERHPDLPWKAMYGLRNLVSHDYANIASRFVWAATEELEPIRVMSVAELVRIRSA